MSKKTIMILSVTVAMFFLLNVIDFVAFKSRSPVSLLALLLSAAAVIQLILLLRKR